MRAFIAVTVPAVAQASLQALQQRFAEARADVSWVTAPRLHLTLKFFEALTPPEQARLTEHLAHFAASQEPFPCRLGGLGAFPAPTAPRVIWAGFAEGGDRLRQLAEALDDALAAMGFAREARAFAPHVTIGRVRSGKGLAALRRMLQEPWAGPAGWTVDAVRLYKSVLQPGGAVHTLLADCPLKQRAADSAGAGRARPGPPGP